MSLTDKILSTSNSKHSALMSETPFFDNTGKSIITDIPIMNVALSGKVDGGMKSGILQIAGESKHFKTLYGLKLVSKFLEQNEDGVVVLYDTEFGISESYLKRYNIDKSRIAHIPIGSVEELKNEASNLLDMLKEQKEQKVMILLDSLGNLASKKEKEDAKDGSTKADMTRAKQIKSFFRIINVDIKLLGVYMVVINHTYKSQGFIAMDVVSSGTGAYYNSNDVWIVKRKQSKDGKEVAGYEFKIVIDKSRFVKEKSQFPIIVHWEDGIHKYSGLDEIALNGKFIKLSKDDTIKGKPKIYKYKDIDTLVSESDINEEFWEIVLKDKEFTDYIEKTYKQE